MSATRILLVEDEDSQRRLLTDILSGAGHQVCEARGQSEASSQLQGENGFDLVISDWKLEDGDGSALLEEVSRSHPGTSFIMVTAYGSIAHAVEAVQAGADDYLAKPFERQALLMAVERTLKSQALKDENRRLNEALEERERLVDIVGRAPRMQQLYRRIEKIAGTEATVLLAGESGTGKELVARAIHALSRRSDGPFVAVNCAAIPEGLMEAEFLGAEKGAYTGAHARRPGKFEAAARGTLFLDEIGELPLSIQPKLLRALQEGRVTRVGGNQEIETDVRIIAASNRDLSEELRAGRFREDLYYRLNVVPIALPPLRDRREDIPTLVDHFRDKTARVHAIESETFPKRVMRKLLDYPWPGNVRELGNVVERLILLSDAGMVSEDDLPGEMQPALTSAEHFQLPAGGLSWDSLEASALRQALDAANGNRTQAAKLLDMPYKAFLYRLEKHAIE
jgi:two-component system NtrC family response regulator